jgi:uncharacterized membrane protein YkgB
MSIICLNDLPNVEKRCINQVSKKILISLIILSILLIISIFLYYPSESYNSNDISHITSFSYKPLLGFEAEEGKIHTIDQFLHAIDENRGVKGTGELYGLTGNMYYITNLTPIKKSYLTGFLGYFSWENSSFADTIDETFLIELPELFCAYSDVTWSPHHQFFIVEDFFKNILEYKMVYNDGINRIYKNPTNSIPNSSQKAKILKYMGDLYNSDNSPQKAKISYQRSLSFSHGQ